MHKILPELVTQNHRFLLGDARQLCGSSRLRSDNLVSDIQRVCGNY